MRISDIKVDRIYTNSIFPGGLHRKVIYEGTWSGFKDPLRVQYVYMDGPSAKKRGSCSKKKFAQWAVRMVFTYPSFTSAQSRSPRQDGGR
jgi:hypothetical protein